MYVLVKWLIFTFAVYGLANAIAVLKIGRFIFGVGYCKDQKCTHPSHPQEQRRLIGKIPYLGDLFYCPPCVGFWVAMAMSWFFLSPGMEFMKVKWQAMVVDGLAASGVVYLLHMAAERLGHKLDI